MRKQDRIGDFGDAIVLSWVNFICKYYHLDMVDDVQEGYQEGVLEGHVWR